MKEKMGKAGYVQGEMSPHVEDYQKPMSNYAEAQFSKTLEYIERKDSFEKKEAKDIQKQDYKGRYS